MKATEFQKNQMLARGMEPEQVKAAIEMGERFQAPTIQIAIGLIVSLFLGTVFSLIGGLILKKDKTAR